MDPKGSRIKMFSILTLNLRFGLATRGPNWAVRKQGFPDLLNGCCSDFYCFQEANDFQINDLQSILTDCRLIGKRSPSPGFWQNNIIFYRHPWKCVFYDHFFLSLTPSIPSRFAASKWPRQCTLGIFEKGGFRCICITTHFDFDPQIQALSARLILARLAKLPADLPVVICGDFNSAPSGPCYRLFTGEEGDPALGFKNVFPEPFPGTHHGFTGNRDGDHIDWILYRGKISNAEARVVAKNFKGIYPSDHFPLWAAFLCANQRQTGRKAPGF
jgi:endonuclease/exonuclease/phosphatase family metal-dependent hydrolase